MDLYDEKLKKVIKSCDTSSKIVKVAWIVFSVLTVVAFVTAIVLACNVENVNNAIIERGLQDMSMPGMINGMDITSDVPAIQKYFDEHQYGYAYTTIFRTVFLGGMFLISTILLAIFNSIFKLIKESETPFVESVKKKLRNSFVFIVVVLAFSVSLMTAVVAALILWCVYNIFSYGCELQRQSDETL